MAEASDLGGVTALRLQIGEHRISVACDSKKATALLESALGDHVVHDDHTSDLTFLLNRPRALERSHFLFDRSGFLLSRNRGIDSGLSALGSHLSAYLPPQEGCVRLRGRTVLVDGQAIICMAPLLLSPRIEEKTLARHGMSLVDRLACDVHVDTARIRQASAPWPELASLAAGDGHHDAALDCDVPAILLLLPTGAPPPSKADVAALLASNTLAGDPDRVLDACVRLTTSAQIRTVAPSNDPDDIVHALLGHRTG